MMKKRLIILLVCAVLLCGTASAAAGGTDDPLVSKSYVDETFLPKARGAISASAGSAVAYYLSESAGTPGSKLVYLRRGQCVTLGEGQQFLLVSGGADLYTERGEVVNAAAGAVLEDGAVPLYSHCIVCEESQVYVDVTENSVLKVSFSAEVGTGSPFGDVTRGAWYYSDVSDAYGRGLIDGMTASEYAPSGTLTGAQCVKLAACMHQLYQTNMVTLEPSDGVWYRGYVEYALANGIMDRELADYDSPVTRAQFVDLFYRALPESAYAEINAIPDGAIPDVAADPEVYRFYRAGILAGYVNTADYPDHAFGPDSTITRAEVAAIMNRMFDPTARIFFTI